MYWDLSVTKVPLISKLLMIKKKSLMSAYKDQKPYAEDTITIEDTTLLHFFDTPHLIKGVRNNLLKGNIFWEEGSILKQAAWQPVINLYNLDKDRAIRGCPKLTEEHVMPSKIKKMNVKKTAQVFSQRVSSALSFMADFGMYLYFLYYTYVIVFLIITVCLVSFCLVKLSIFL